WPPPTPLQPPTPQDRRFCRRSSSHASAARACALAASRSDAWASARRSGSDGSWIATKVCRSSSALLISASTSS
ncbi:hypothetical protein HK405_005150, partial [Cladochytrium tenue]